jgi:hypothetical protein
MLRFERIDADSDWGGGLDAFPDRHVFQTPAWLRFLTATQREEPIVAALREEDRTVGYFTGLLMRKLGLRILGSPFPGWSTPYMGLNLMPGVERRAALKLLVGFAFSELKCAHFEMVDLHATLENASGLALEHTMHPTCVIDLTAGEKDLWASMNGSARRAIRKAEKSGVTIEEAHDLQFADEYFAQLQDVYAKQKLAPPLDVERIRALIRILEPAGMLLMLRARTADGLSIASGLYPFYNHTLFVLGNASWREHQNLRPNEAMHWYAMRWGGRRGIVHCNMVGNKEFKKKFGGYETSSPLLSKSRNRLIAGLRRSGPGAMKSLLRLKRSLQRDKAASSRAAVPSPLSLEGWPFGHEQTLHYEQGLSRQRIVRCLAGMMPRLRLPGEIITRKTRASQAELSSVEVINASS